MIVIIVIIVTIMVIVKLIITVTNNKKKNNDNPHRPATGVAGRPRLAADKRGQREWGHCKSR